MNKHLVLAVLCAAILGSFPVLAQDVHEVVYLEGFPVRRDTAGSEDELEIGDGLVTGETVVTTEDETVEMEAGGYKVTVGSNTVFRIMEVEEEGETRTVLANILGKLRFVRNRAAGREPLLVSNSAVCGVRGTEFTIWSGDDGGSLIIVADGAVEVSSGGEAVALTRGEGVEVDTGSAPGEKFQALGREIDHDDWNAARRAKMLEDPVAAAQNIEKQLDGYIEQIDTITPLYEAKKAELDRLRDQGKAIQEKEGAEKATEFYNQTISPVELESLYLITNLRFYSLSALSLRRFVAGRLYLQMKSAYITNPDAAAYREYHRAHERILDKYGDKVVKNLVPADI